MNAYTYKADLQLLINQAMHSMFIDYRVKSKNSERKHACEKHANRNAAVTLLLPDDNINQLHHCAAQK